MISGVTSTDLSILQQGVKPTKESKKRKIEKMGPPSLEPVPSLIPFVPHSVQITVRETNQLEEATIFLTCENSYPSVNEVLSYTNRLFTLRLLKKWYPVGDVSVDYYPGHLWVNSLNNRQPKKYKGVGSALMQTVIQQSFLQGREGRVHLYSHGRTAGFYWGLGFTPLEKRILIPRYPGLKELTEKLAVCKKRLSLITSSDLELWPIIAEAQKILAQEQARGGKPSALIDGEYLLKEWFWSHGKQPQVSVSTLALFQAIFAKKRLIVDNQLYAPLPQEDVLNGEMHLSKKTLRSWKERLFKS